MSNLKCYSVLDGAKDSLNFVFLHGYGANGRDLVGLSGYPDLKELKANWYFLEAPLSPPELAILGGRAWFNITLSSLGPNADLGEFYDQEHKEIESSFEMIKSSLWDLNIDLKNTFIGGFSQGAMMASKVFFEDSKAFKGLISFSGAPLHRKKWNLKKRDPKQKVFLSHGMQDPVLKFKCAEDLDKCIEGFNKKTLWFNGQHEIPHEVLTSLADFIK